MWLSPHTHLFCFAATWSLIMSQQHRGGQVECMHRGNRWIFIAVVIVGLVCVCWVSALLSMHHLSLASLLSIDWTWLPRSMKEPTMSTELPAVSTVGSGSADVIWILVFCQFICWPSCSWASSFMIQGLEAEPLAQCPGLLSVWQ